MQLETITANIRTRTPWEAIDLGFAMVRAWWISIYTPLAILMTGIITILLIVIPYEYYFVSLLIMWWLKPLYHRLILHVISHQMFGDSPAWSATLKALPDLILHTGLFSELTWRRFSLSRGFRLPVWQLERMKGKERSQRQQLLLSNVHTASIWLNIAIFNFQIILSTSFLMLIWLFIPKYYAEDLFYKLASNQLGGIGYSIEVIAVMGFVIVLVFLEPFYIAASFSMYLNRRTQLEAWDIELTFRKMANRLTELQNKLTAVIACLITALCIASFSPQTVWAVNTEGTETTTRLIEPGYIEHLSDIKQPVEESLRIIKEVMKNEHLRQEAATMRWRFIETNEPIEGSDTPAWLKSIATFIASLLEYTLWIGIAIGIVLLYIYRKHWLPLLIRLPEEIEPLRPDILFGMDLRNESLPADVAGSAKALWQQGNVRDALSLLYRCALAQLINHDKLPLEHSHTEGDILRISKQVLTETRHDYLRKLTQNWVKIAYAHESPSESEMIHLLDHWSDDFAVNTTGNRS